MDFSKIDPQVWMGLGGRLLQAAGSNQNLASGLGYGLSGMPGDMQKIQQLATQKKLADMRTDLMTQEAESRKTNLKISNELRGSFAKQNALGGVEGKYGGLTLNQLGTVQSAAAGQWAPTLGGGIERVIWAAKPGETEERPYGIDDQGNTTELKGDLHKVRTGMNIKTKDFEINTGQPVGTVGGQPVGGILQRNIQKRMLQMQAANDRIDKALALAKPEYYTHWGALRGQIAKQSAKFSPSGRGFDEQFASQRKEAISHIGAVFTEEKLRISGQAASEKENTNLIKFIPDMDDAYWEVHAKARAMQQGLAMIEQRQQAALTAGIKPGSPRMDKYINDNPLKFPGYETFRASITPQVPKVPQGYMRMPKDQQLQFKLQAAQIMMEGGMSYQEAVDAIALGGY